MDSYGRHDLIEYLKRHPEGIPQADAVLFLKHPNKNNRYRAISQMQDKQQVIRRHVNGVAWLFPGPNIAEGLPDIDDVVLTSTGSLQALLAVLVKFNYQHRNQAATKRLNAIVLSIVQARRVEMELISTMLRLLSNDSSQADWDFVAAQLQPKGYVTLSIDKDIRDNIGFIVHDLLPKMGALSLGYTEEELESLADFNDKSSLEVRRTTQQTP